jgi:putative transcription factor
MPECEICGRYTDELYTIEVEGAILQVCKQCSTKGKFIAKVREEKPKKQVTIINEQPVEELIDDYDKVIKEERKKMGLTQEELAKKINEQLTTIKKIENGDLHPTEKQAKKFEKLFGIKLYQVIKKQSLEELKKPDKKESLTLADVVKIKKKKQRN